MSLTEVKSHLTTRQCLVWETEKPFVDRPRESPVFRFMNSEWCLKLIYDSRSPPSYDIYIVDKSDLNTFPSFAVTIHFENPRKGSESMFCRRRNISSPRDHLWRVNTKEFIEAIPDLDIYGDFTLVCLFEVASGSTLPIKRTEHKSVQASLDSATPWKSHLEARNLYDSSLTSLELPFSLESLSQDLENLLDKNLLPDVQLKSGDRTIPAHRTVLAARSEVFAAMFRHEMAESSSGIIDIKDIDSPELDVFLKYVYSGKVSDDLSEDMVSKLYVAGDKYAVYALKKICSSFMIRNINEKNFITFLSLADSHSDQEFKNAVASFITKDDTLLKSEVWFEFAAEKPVLATEMFCKYFGK